jgi:hypothetical protein
MNVRFRRAIAGVVCFLMLVSLGINLRAQSAPPPPPPPPANPTVTIGLLTQAYAALSVADHDYKGHRVLAMKQIEAAAKELGVALKGDNHVREVQVASDQQLRVAQSLLQQAAPALQGKVRMHVDKALEQLSIALSIK